MFRFLPLALFALACSSKPQDGLVVLDLTERLGEGEVRAGTITDERALFGGISAEGQTGDVKIYNAQAQFVIQAVRESGYYVEYGGAVIDADIIRAAGQPGHDMIDDAGLMVGFGRMFNPDSVEIIADGSDGEAAIIRAEGGGGPLTLLTGTLESSGLIQNRDLQIRTDYVLEPDSSLLRMDTTVWWNDVATQIQLADMAFLAFDVTEAYLQGVGMDGDLPDTYGWIGAVGRRNEGALALMQTEDDFTANAILQGISDLAPLLVGSTEPMELNDGDSITWSRYLGVGPDLATLTNEWHERRGDTVETVGGAVTSAGEVVPGARVHVLDEEDMPLTMAITDEVGTWTADVPVGTASGVLATSRGPGISYDRQPGAGWYGPYAAAPVKGRVLTALKDGATPVAYTPGFGVSLPAPASAETSLTLVQPGTLHVTIDDGGPAVVRVDFIDGDPVVAPTHLAQDRPSGRMGWLYLTDGAGSMDIEPGTYDIVVHRGLRFEAHVETVTLASGEDVSIHAALEQSVHVPGVWALDPHSHAAPSGDGSIPMEGRLAVHAAHGVDVHFGTDHDHVADYRVLLEPMGLDPWLGSIVADEVSPTLRGHHNAYPLESVPDLPNGGAVAWYRTWLESWTSTTELYELMRAMASDGEVLIQANHPTSSSGLLANAGYRLDEGVVANGNRWSSDFDAIEVLNDGGYADPFAYYLDLINRGLRPAPVGVSDSHSHRGGVGENVTWALMDIESIQDLTNDDIRSAIGGTGTVASHGPLIEARVDGVWAPGLDTEGPTTVSVTVHAPSWMEVDTLTLFENGVAGSAIPISAGSPTSLELDPDSDSVYVIVASGEQDMSPVYPGQIPWAMTEGLFIDADGDGEWTPPLPSLVVH